MEQEAALERQRRLKSLASSAANKNPNTKISESVFAPTLEQKAVQILDTELVGDEIVADTQNVQLDSLTPKPVDWDLKERFAPKLEALKAETMQCIDQIVRSKLENDS